MKKSGKQKIVQGVAYTMRADADPRYEQLADRLIAHKGNQLVPMPEGGFDALLESGIFYAPEEVFVWPGPPSNCHQNSVLFVLSHPDFEVHTGYALTGDKWRQHSWCWNPQTEVLVETTNMREGYFGIREPRESERLEELRCMFEKSGMKIPEIELPGLGTGRVSDVLPGLP